MKKLLIFLLILALALCTLCACGTDDGDGNSGEGSNEGGDNTGSDDNEGGGNTGSGDNEGGDNTGSGGNEGGDNTGSGGNEGGGNTGSGDNEGGNTGSGDNEGGDNTGSGDGDDGGDDMTDYIPSATVLAVRGGANGIVVLQHDDGSFETAVVMDRLLRKYGLIADVALLANRVWNADSDTPKASSIEKWRQILDTGRWKVVSHSLTHTWWGTATDDGLGGYILADDIEKMTAEIVGSQQMLRKAFPDQKVLTFAYPGFTSQKNSYTNGTEEEVLRYIYSEAARQLIGETYIGGRRVQTAYSVTDKTIDWTMTGCYHIGGNYTSSYATKAGQEGKLMVLYVHNVTEVPEDELKTYDYPANTMAAYYFEHTCKQVAAGIADGTVWNAHYEDAVMYLREAQTASVSVTGDKGGLKVLLTDEMDDSVYTFPLTVELEVPESWEAVKIIQGNSVSYARVSFKPAFGGDKYIALADIVPDGGEATVIPVPVSEIPRVEESEPAPSPTLPEEIVIPPAESFEDIKDGDIGTGQFKVGNLEFCQHIQASVTAVGTIISEGENKYLNIAKTAYEGNGAQNWLNIVRGSSDGEGVRFEAKLRFDFANSGAIYFRFYNGRTASGNGGTAHHTTRHTIKASGGRIYFCNTELGVANGEWFTLRAEISKDGILSVSVKADGEDSFELKYTDTETYADFAGADGVTIITSSKSLVTFALDDITFGNLSELGESDEGGSGDNEGGNSGSGEGEGGGNTGSDGNEGSGEGEGGGNTGSGEGEGGSGDNEGGNSGSGEGEGGGNTGSGNTDSDDKYFDDDGWTRP
ncbi:MAG: polysaccharide deacetylase family protein [Clostridia bacterium]|nr:polysaccharide deacetylase family protein [Clostridia bacterium]